MPTFYGTDDATVTTLISSGVASVTYSNDQSIIYAVRRDGVIERYATATGVLLGSWNIGVGLGGVSLSEDGGFLMVTRADHAGTVYRVDTATGAVQAYTPSVSTNFHDVEIVDAQTAILTGPQPMSLNLATGVFSPLANAVSYSGYSMILAEDAHLTLIAEPGISNGPLAIYDDRTGTIVARGDNYQSGLGSGFNWGHQAISEAAGLVVQFNYYSSLNVYNLSLQAIRNVSISGRVDGLAFSPDGQFLYAYLIDTGVVAKYATNDFTLVDQYTVGTSQWHNNIGYGDQLHISDDGQYITLADTSSTGALRLIHLTGRDDTFAGTASADSFYGFDGNDTYVVNHIGDLVFEDANKGTDTVQTSVDYTLTANVENLTATGVNALVVRGNSLANIITGNAAASTLNGGLGNDRLIVGAGADGTVVNGGSDSDTLAVTGSLTLGGVTGIEALELAGGAALTVTGTQFKTGLASNTSLSGSGTLTVNMDVAGNFISKLFNFTGNGVSLVVNGTSGNDIFKLGNAVHTVNAGDGIDQIKGGNAADTINGGNGVDKINGAGGADIMTGGAGNDVFKYGAATDSGLGAAADRVTDFVIGGDRLNFTQIDANAGIGGDQAFAFVGNGAFSGGGAGSIRYQDSGADLLVQVDVDGNGTVDMEVILQGLAGQTLTSGDFVL